MKFIIIVMMSYADPFIIPILEFNSKEQCVEYVMNPANSDRLAVEVIAKAGFNDEITGVLCLPENQNVVEVPDEA
jgi:hypothetical protein|tara:strand:+ start:1678 stop:1902 length:225 start_codon:yes stop_codon:yes gene_type:complete